MKLRKMVIAVLAATMLMSLSACKDASSTTELEETVTTTEAAEETVEETKEAETEEESTSSDDSQTEEADSTEEASDDAETEEAESSEDDAPAGDGLMSEEDLQKGWAWTKSLGFDIYYKHYEDISEYFGLDGELVRNELSDATKRNWRVYKWISKEDESHYIMVNFEEKDAEGEPGVYTLTGISANGFDPEEAVEKYGDEVK